MEEIVDGRNTKTGKFVKGNSVAKGRPKGSRNKMTQRMLNRVCERSEDGLSMEEIMMDIAQDPNMPAELRFKAAAKVSDLVYPKASSVEVRWMTKRICRRNRLIIAYVNCLQVAWVNN